MMDKVTTFRGRSGTVDFTVVVNRTCRWCHAQITDRNTVNCKLDTESLGRYFVAGGFNYFFIFTPKIGEDEPILTHIFQMGGSSTN